MSRLNIRAIRREQVLDAAEHLMSEQGWQAVTFANICRAADISHGVLTYHFTDKEDLLFALFERSLGRMQQGTAPPMFAPGQPLAHRIEALFAGVAEAVPRELHLLAAHFVAQVDGRPDLAERIHNRTQEQVAGLAAILSRDADSGELKTDPEEAAALLLCVVIGLGLVRAACGVEPPPGAVAAMLSGYLTGKGSPDAGLGKPAAGPGATTDHDHDPPARRAPRGHEG